MRISSQRVTNADGNGDNNVYVVLDEYTTLTLNTAQKKKVGKRRKDNAEPAQTASPTKGKREDEEQNRKKKSDNDEDGADGGDAEMVEAKPEAIARRIECPRCCEDEMTPGPKCSFENLSDTFITPRAPNASNPIVPNACTPSQATEENATDRRHKKRWVNSIYDVVVVFYVSYTLTSPAIVAEAISLLLF